MPEIPNLFTIFNVLDISPQKYVYRGKIWASERLEFWSAAPNPGVGELLIQGFAQRLVKMRRCSVMY
jgi:hypothetical protein